MTLRAALIFLVLGFIGLLLVMGAVTCARWAVPARAAGSKWSRASRGEL